MKPTFFAQIDDSAFAKSPCGSWSRLVVGGDVLGLTDDAVDEVQGLV